MTPLYGHNSEETAYTVDDYPYGFRLRCKIRYWLEKSNTKGFRFCSQTENPKTGRWNKPKKGTYSLLAMCLYLAENGHVACWSLNEYSSGSDVFGFVKHFPQADMTLIKRFAVKKIPYLKAAAAGLIVWSINGVAQPVRQSDIDSAKVDLEGWEAALGELNNQAA